MPIRTCKCRDTACSGQESLSSSLPGPTASTTCQGFPSADHQVADSVSAELSWVTTFGAESSSDNANTQVLSDWFPIDGKSHEHRDDMECLNTDTESRDLCTTDSRLLIHSLLIHIVSIICFMIPSQ